ncbi:MAG: extracellular solute-binding protein [Nostocaceae cyanobacterium]|nr:extracellular solute-binding protein [Nostocaceae cyanobacterium]
MHRRSFLQGTLIVALSQLLGGCGSNRKPTLKVQLLKNSIPAQVVNKFSKQHRQIQLNFTPVEQLETLFNKLKKWQEKKPAEKNQGFPDSLFGKSQTTNVPDLVTLGDYWLEAAIEQKLIQPLDIEQKEFEGRFQSQKWGELVTRDGKIWGVPYRWGSTIIIYNRHKFKKLGWMPQDWSDLWRDELRDRISILDQPREVIGLVLKKLGESYNTDNLDKVPELEKELALLNQQVKFYSSNQYLEPLIIGDTWLAVGWSNDILPIISRYPQFSAVIPQSGTALWADLWVRPQENKGDKEDKGEVEDKGEGEDKKDKNKSEDLLYEWINFCWEPHIAKQILLSTKANSPIDNISVDKSEIHKQLRNVLFSEPEVINKSEFLRFMPQEIDEQYTALFAKIKRKVIN